jgi:hypothetical protein
MVLPNPAPLDAGAPPKLKALPLAAPLLAPKKVDVEPGVDPGAPKAVLLPGVPKALAVLAPNRDVPPGTPNAGVEVAAPNAGVAVPPNMVLPVLAPKAGAALLAPKPCVLAPKGAEAAGVPKAKPPLAGCGRTTPLQAAHQQGMTETTVLRLFNRVRNWRYHHGMLAAVQEAVSTQNYCG